MGQWRFRRTTLISFGLAGFLLGLVLARRVAASAIVLVPVGMLCPLLFKRSLLSLLSISIVGLLLGTWRGTVFRQVLLPYSLLAGQTVTIQVKATSDAVYGKKKQLSFDASNVKVVSPLAQRLPGTVAVGGYGLPMVYRGDTLQVVGKLYQTRGSRQAGISFARLTHLQTDRSLLYVVGRRFAAALQSALPEPHGSFVLGLLVGQRTTLPDQLNNNLSTVGLTHIVAVSGYNLTILVELARRLFGRFSKYQATVLTLGLIGCFVILSGGSASIVRAALVSGLSLWAWYYGRSIRPGLLILLAAALTAGWFPLYLWSDIGWHLSFLAFAGILLLAPLLVQRLGGEERLGTLGMLLVETSCAQLVTTPLILFIFGRLSIVALATNLLVLPGIPLTMLAGFVAGLAGWVLPWIAGWIAWPARLLATYVLDIVNVVARLPHAAVVAQLNWLQMAACYGLILLLALAWRKTSQNGKIQIRIPEEKHVRT
jgi:competence protein ComEC